MNTTEANIEIIRHGETLSSVSVIMPRWIKAEYDNTLSVNIPFFGIKTFAKDEEDSEIAIEEAIKCFCLAAERFGQGVEAELQTLGWNRIKEENEHSLLSYSVPDTNVVLEQIMQTGEQYAHNLEIEEAVA